MYIELVRRVLEEAVKTYAAGKGLAVPDVLAQIREHIDKTAREHRRDEPNIDYDDPLCRLGYLYRHAPANATIFEQVLQGSDELRDKIRRAHKGVLHVCSVGGGPGTELLGLAKHLLRRSLISRLLRRPRHLPRKIIFTVLDNIPHWAETWQQLAEAVEAEIRAALTGEDAEAPTIAPTFLPMDVLDPASYQQYAFQFSKADVIVFNYLFSENKTRLVDALDSVRHLARTCPPGCVFVVIDRLEHSPTFSDQVRGLFQTAFGVDATVHTFKGTIDRDEQTTGMGEMLTAVLGNPRVKFFTDGYRDPTVFWFTVVRG